MSKAILFLFFGVLIIGAGLLFFFSAGTPQNGGNSPENGATGALRPLPDLTFQDYEGNTVALGSLVGKPLVVNSWAAWCPFCVDELPDFAEVQREHENEIVIVAIDRAEPLSVAKKFSDEVGVTDDLLFLLDPRDEFYKAIGGFSMPETIFVDRDGNIRDHKRGPMTAEEIRQRLQSIL